MDRYFARHGIRSSRTTGMFVKGIIGAFARVNMAFLDCVYSSSTLWEDHAQMKWLTPLTMPLLDRRKRSRRVRRILRNICQREKEQHGSSHRVVLWSFFRCHLKWDPWRSQRNHIAGSKQNDINPSIPYFKRTPNSDFVFSFLFYPFFSKLSRVEKVYATYMHRNPKALYFITFNQ